MSNRIGPIDLPSGRTVTFREPRNSDRRELLEGFDGESLNKPGKLEEALAYTCLLELDSKPLSDLGWAKRADQLNIKDGQFYQALFLDMFTIGKDDMQRIQALSKKLLGSATAES